MAITIRGFAVAAYFAAAVFGMNATLSAAQESGSPTLSLELNNLTKGDSGCLATFMAKNDLQRPLERVAFEVVLFDTEGRVDRLLLLDFSPLPENKTRVRQFELAGMECAGISRVLVNDAAECTGTDIEPGSCISSLTTAVRVPVEFGS